jgi:hypothetical protein
VEVVSLHLHGAAAPLSVQSPTAPPALCALIHQMLEKVPSARPTAVEARERMSEIAQALKDTHSEFESYEITTKPWIPLQGVPIVELVTSLVKLAKPSKPSVMIGRPIWTPKPPSLVPGLLSSARTHGTSPASWRRVLSSRKHRA